MRRLAPIILALNLALETSTTCDLSLVSDLSFKLSGSNIAFPCPSTKHIYQNSGRYVPKHIIATRMQVFTSDAIVAIPRFKHGVPFTLGKFSLKTKGCKATITAFPCWSMQEEGNCQALQSVVDLVLDPMDVLWVLDAGIVNTLEQPVLRCPPKIVGVNAKTGQVVKVIDLSAFAKLESRLQYLLVDYTSDGKAFAFVTDAGVGGVVVYDVFGEKGFRVVLPPAAGSKTPTKDALYIALVRQSTGNVVLLSYLSSPNVFSVKEDHLVSDQTAGSITEVGLKPKPMVFLGTDNGASLFFRYKGESDIYVWNSQSAFCEDNFLSVQAGSECRLPTQVVPGYKKLMWVIESNFHDYVADTTGVLGASMTAHPLIKTAE